MLVPGTRRLCRVGLAAVLATALCALTLMDLPPQPPDPPPDPPPTQGGEPPGTLLIVAYSWARRLALDYRPSVKCTPRGSTETALIMSESSGGDLPSPKWLETISGQLFLYSSHLDLRVAAYPSVRVIGVRRGPLTALFCTIWYEEYGTVKSISMEALISDIWLDGWGGGSDTYTGLLITCPLPRLLHPLRTVVSTTACNKNPSHSLEISPDRNKNLMPKRPFTLCVKGLDFEEDISYRIIAFVELHRILGAERFYFYVFNVHENVLKVLRLYERSNVVRWINLTLPGNLPNDKIRRREFLKDNIWVKRRMELIPYNHCFYENLYDSEFVVPIDIDETIIPVRRKNWSQLFIDARRKLGKTFNDYASYAVRNAYFFNELQIDNERKSHSDELPNIDYLNTIRTASVSPEGHSDKSFISTKRALTVHNHYPLTTLDPSTRRTHHLDSSDVLKHHHRLCDDRHLDCDLLMEEIQVDESALRYGDELKERMKGVLANLNDPLG